MAKVIGYGQALKVWLLMLAAMLLLIFGGLFSDRLIHSTDAYAMARWFGVAVGIVIVIPWMLTIVWGVSAGDEYVRQVALVGTAIAFAIDILAYVGFNAAQEARLVSWSAHLPPLLVAMGAWLIGVSVAALYYRFRP